MFRTGGGDRGDNECMRPSAPSAKGAPRGTAIAGLYQEELPMQHRILLVENDTNTANRLEMNLRDFGYRVMLESTGTGGLTRAENESFSLLILGQVLPGIGGLEICRKLRGKEDPVAILILSAFAEAEHRIAGLEAGADDIVTRPFSVMELLARVKSILRRYEYTAHTDHEAIRLNDLQIDLRRHQVLVKGKPIKLTAKEFGLLTFFAQNPGHVFTRAHLVDRVWGPSYSGFDNTVCSHINRLRTKIEDDPSKPTRILTVRNVGYKFHDHAESGL
jgi:DNA-binding response OmpR family regulator